jgi:negative regulator of sigma E activity
MIPVSDDEWLSCYRDGELDEAARSAFEQRLAAEPALAARLADWGRHDALVGQGLDAVLAAPMPAAVLALLENRELENREEAEVVDLAAVRARRQPASARPAPYRRWLPAAAVAASLIVAVLVGKPALTADSDAQAAVELALDTLPSGQSVTAGGARLAPKLSFIAGDGRWCREYEEQRGTGTRTSVACRSGPDWRVEGSTRAAAGETATGSDYAAAAGADDAALDAVYARLKAGDPLSAADEQRLIAASRR